MNSSVNECQECGTAFQSKKQALFCCTPCRLSFNNRRMQRGAELYDLFRSLRRERAEAKRLNIWTQICRLELQWQTEDDKQRPGRRSYMPPKKALANLHDKGSIPRGDVLVKPRATS